MLESLNPSQKEAVLSFDNPLLILAGAGSGKTRVLTHKISYALSEGIIQPQNFLAVTFTNKAAGEMKERLHSLHPNISMRESWVATFHSFGNRLLRSSIGSLGYTNDFTIFDSADQTALVKSILKDLRYDNSAANARKVARQIQSLKTDLSIIQDLDNHNLPHITRDVFETYQKKLKQNNALDFNDLLLKTLELLKTDEAVRSRMQETFKYILVDEYQDTNLIQYEIIKLLSRNRDNVCAVGDEDQSIYSWRGANIFNILHFDQDFPNTKVIKLEQNYRSTQNIINAASAVIANNKQRKGKTLFTENAEGSLISLIESQSEYDESQTICQQIHTQVSEGQFTYDDVAIFYRTNAQSRVFEEHLRNKNIPYRIIGGLKFYDRKEIKDILAYMRLIVNPKDDVSFRRVINTPTRGLGKTTLEKIEIYAGAGSMSLIEASIEMVQNKSFTARTSNKLQGFLDIISQLREVCMQSELYEFYQELLQLSTYLPSLEKEGTMEAQSRIQNLEEFGNAIVRYTEQFPEEQHITQFLHHMALVSGEESSNQEDEKAVTLMTLHVAKGLEFPLVFVSGLEEGLFPHAGHMNNTDDFELEEERRLFYVGMTRAKTDLVLSYAKQRKVWGQNQFQSPSRFIEEVPSQYMKHRLPKKPKIYQKYGESKESYNRDPFPDYESESQSAGFEKGTRVMHPHFGSGVIYKVEGQGSKEKVSVLFDDKTLKKFLAQYANLEFI